MCSITLIGCGSGISSSIILLVFVGEFNFELQWGQLSSEYSTVKVGTGSGLSYFGCPFGAPSFPDWILNLFF